LAARHARAFQRSLWLDRREKEHLAATLQDLRAPGISSLLSTTTRSGWRGVSTSRTVRRGSSALTVPIPVRIAQARARQRWPSLRASSPVIHWLRPSDSAVRPSSVAAIFIRTHGRERVIREKKPMFISRASSSIKPCSIPDAGRRKRARAIACFGIRIAHRRDDPRDARGGERRRARRSAALMIARLERHVSRGAARCRPGSGQRIRFGVRSSRFFVPAFADDAAVPRKHAADARIRRGRIQPVFGERQRTPHHGVVERREGTHRRRRVDFATSCTASRKSSGVSKLR
jgi:hypothetical protein